MSYTSFNDLTNTIRTNLWKVPQDIDLIVGVPRSGMLAAILLSEYINKRVADLDSFISGVEVKTGSRGRNIKKSAVKRVFVLDDTVFGGGSMNKVRERLEPMKGKYEFIYACVYAEGRNAKEMVDIYLEDNYNPNEELWHLYEWNILHHGIRLSSRCMFDMDGVLCKEPPDERELAAYEAYLPKALPMVVPTTEVGAIVTYRLEKYRNVTEAWLKKQGIQYKALHMFQADTYEERRETERASAYKARMYKSADWALLFVESNPRQAELIAQMSGKQVFCYGNGRMYEAGGNQR